MAPVRLPPVYERPVDSGLVPMGLQRRHSSCWQPQAGASVGSVGLVRCQPDPLD